MEWQVTFGQVTLTLLYLLPGFFLGKTGRAKPEHLPTLSAIMIYLGTPCIVLSGFLPLTFSWHGIANMGIFLLASALLELAFLLLLFLLLRRRGEARYRIMQIASIAGNVGFFGMPILRALLPNHPEAICYVSMYSISMNLLAFTIGVFCLTRKKEYISLRTALCNPATFGLALSLLLYLTGANACIPDLLRDGISLIASMTTPLCMIILGVRLSTISLRELFSRPFVYVVCLLKLVAFPLFCYAAVYFLPLDTSLKASLLILSAVPCASVILNLAELHQTGQSLAANCVLLSTLLSIVTIPLLSLLLPA